MNETQPLLPAEPWYTSKAQIAGLIAGLSLVASIVIRWFGLPVTDEQLTQISLDFTNLITLAGGAYAMWQRYKSNIAPQALTKARAEAKTAANPPILESDPTKVSK